MNKILNRALLVLSIACIAIIAFDIGLYNAPERRVEVPDSRLNGLHEVQCDDIVKPISGSNYVCEISMQAEDDNVHVFRGPGAYGD